MNNFEKFEGQALRLFNLESVMHYAYNAYQDLGSKVNLTACPSHELSISQHTMPRYPKPTLLRRPASLFKVYLGPIALIATINSSLLHVFLNPDLLGCHYQQIAGRSQEGQKFGHNNVLSIGVLSFKQRNAVNMILKASESKIIRQLSMRKEVA